MPESRISDLHIYLPEPERREIIAWAQSEGRTASNLVKYIVRQALASRDAKHRPLTAAQFNRSKLPRP